MPGGAQRLTERVCGWWRAPAPARPLGILRVTIGAFALGQLGYDTPSLLAVLDFLPRQFHPVGIATWLSEPVAAQVLYAGLAAGFALGLCFTLGFGYALTAPGFALALLALTTYRSSWGMVLHTDNLLTLHVALLALAPAAAALSIDARRRQALGAASQVEPHARYGWPLRALSIVTVTCYVLAGVAKLKLAGSVWVGGELLRAQVAYDNLRKLELGAPISPLGPWLVQHASIFPGLAVATLLVELGAPLSLVGKRWALGWSLAAWAFHVGVLLTMSIGFPYQLSGLPYLSFFALGSPAFSLIQRRSAHHTSRG
jgi:hypothetical protein